MIRNWRKCANLDSVQAAVIMTRASLGRFIYWPRL